VILTPFGRVLKRCVHFQPRGAVVHDRGNHTELIHSDGRREIFEACDPIDPRRRSESLSFPSESGWIDYTGWYPKTTPLQSFVGYNTVPSTPKTTTSQTLFWFIGTQNNHDREVRILQPVLTYVGPRASSATGVRGWSIASWNCCPTGQVWYSDPITSFKSGDTLLGEIYTNDSGNSYTIDYSTATETTSLTVPTSSLTFDWADVTLEVYDVSSCDQFPAEPVTFSGMVVKTGKGSNAQAETPAWTVTQAKPIQCNDKVNVADPATIVISTASV